MIYLKLRNSNFFNRIRLHYSRKIQQHLSSLERINPTPKTTFAANQKRTARCFLKPSYRVLFRLTSQRNDVFHRAIAFSLRSAGAEPIHAILREARAPNVNRSRCCCRCTGSARKRGKNHRVHSASSSEGKKKKNTASERRKRAFPRERARRGIPRVHTGVLYMYVREPRGLWVDFCRHGRRVLRTYNEFR